MTQTQKILSALLGKNTICTGDRVYITEEKCTDACSCSDKACGAYGRLYIPTEPFSVPAGIFIDLRGVLRNDAESGDIAQFVCEKLKGEFSPSVSVEFGGDSMTFLNMDDRFSVVKALNSQEDAPHNVIFECDYITAEYTLENFGKKPAAFFNDGPKSYIKIIPLDLTEI